MKVFNKVPLGLLVTAAAFTGIAIALTTTVNLHTAYNFAVLAGSGITNTGATTITGDVGTFPTTSQTGFGTVTLNGSNQHGNAVTQGAKTNLVTAYNDAAGRLPVTTIATELGGATLTTGVYDSQDGTFGLTGTLTIDAENDPTAVFIFKAASTFITANSSNVVLINGAQACNIFWIAGSSVTLGTGSHLMGNVIAMQSITLTTGATVDGRVLARNGAVTMDTNTITRSLCEGAVRLVNTNGSAPENQTVSWNIVIAALAVVSTVSVVYGLIKRRKQVSSL